MLWRFICTLGILIITSAACGARQAIPLAVPAQEPRALLEPLRSPEMDALAATLAEKINAYKVSSVVVVGGASPENKVSELGVILRDGLNDALVRHPEGLRVISTADLSELVRRNRLSVGMMNCNLVAEWIADYSRADVAVVLRLERVENDRALVTAEIWDQRTTFPSNKHLKVTVPYARVESQIDLTESQMNSAGRKYDAPLGTPAPKAGKDGVGMPLCVYCPKPDHTEAGRLAKFHGTIYASVTVRLDGTADDIMIERPVGFGLDAMAINTLLGWRFKPAIDGQNHALVTRVPIELSFALD